MRYSVTVKHLCDMVKEFEKDWRNLSLFKFSTEMDYLLGTTVVCTKSVELDSVVPNKTSKEIVVYNVFNTKYYLVEQYITTIEDYKEPEEDSEPIQF